MAGPAKSKYFGIQPYIDQSVVRIERYFGDAKENDALVIGVFGEWGAGKSTLLSAVAERFPNKPVALQGTPDGRAAHPKQTVTVQFNPWRFEREHHLLVPLLKTASKVLNDYVAALIKTQEIGLDPVQQAGAAIKKASCGKPWEWMKDRATTLVNATVALTKMVYVAARIKTQEIGLDPVQQAGAAIKKASCDEILRWLKDRATTLANVTVALTKMVEVKAGIPGFGEVTLSPYEALKAAQEQIDRGNAKKAPKKPQINFESLYYDLHNELHKVTRGDIDKEPGPPKQLNFLFLIDDIDRCLPDKAVEMLEAIKLFLDIPGCAFVLALDDEVVERGIAHRYRDYLDLTDRAAESIAYSLKPERYEEYRRRYSSARLPPITGHEYLEKIVQLPFRLPRWSKEEMREFLRATFPETFPKPMTQPEAAPDKASSPSSQSSSKPDWLLELFVQAVPPVPRKIVRAVELLKFMREVAAARVTSRDLNAYTLAQIVLLQLFAPQLFRFLRRERREAWLTLWRRIEQSRKLATSPSDPAPGYTTRSFFVWWEKQCAADKAKTNASPYTERVEEPFIAELRHATNDRSGFDPRNLFLIDHTEKVDEQLDVYFTLFEPPRVTSDPMSRWLEQRSVTPREPSAFISQLLGTSRDEWLNAINREEGLREAVLDEATFAQLLIDIQTKEFEVKTDWLEITLPIFSFDQIRRLYQGTGLIGKLAEKAGIVTKGKA